MGTFAGRTEGGGCSSAYTGWKADVCYADRKGANECHCLSKRWYARPRNHSHLQKVRNRSDGLCQKPCLGVTVSCDPHFQFHDFLARRIDFNGVESRSVERQKIARLHSSRIERAFPACRRERGSADSKICHRGIVAHPWHQKAESDETEKHMGRSAWSRFIIRSSGQAWSCAITPELTRLINVLIPNYAKVFVVDIPAVARL